MAKANAERQGSYRGANLPHGRDFLLAYCQYPDEASGRAAVGLLLLDETGSAGAFGRGSAELIIARVITSTANSESGE